MALPTDILPTLPRDIFIQTLIDQHPKNILAACNSKIYHGYCEHNNFWRDLIRASYDVDVGNADIHTYRYFWDLSFTTSEMIERIRVEIPFLIAQLNRRDRPSPATLDYQYEETIKRRRDVLSEGMDDLIPIIADVISIIRDYEMEADGKLHDTTIRFFGDNITIVSVTDWGIIARLVRSNRIFLQWLIIEFIDDYALDNDEDLLSRMIYTSFANNFIET